MSGGFFTHSEILVRFLHQPWNIRLHWISQENQQESEFITCSSAAQCSRQVGGGRKTCAVLPAQLLVLYYSSSNICAATDHLRFLTSPVCLANGFIPDLKAPTWTLCPLENRVLTSDAQQGHRSGVCATVPPGADEPSASSQPSCLLLSPHPGCT